MLRIKTESEFYETIGRLMRRARKQNNTSPYWLARWSMYEAVERAMAPISAYQLYIFTRTVAPDWLAKCNWPGIEQK